MSEFVTSGSGTQIPLRSPVLELTVRTCTRCGKFYVRPKSDRRRGPCQRCAPELVAPP